MPRNSKPAAPRIAEPDLPAELSVLRIVPALEPSTELESVRLSGLKGTVEAPYVQLREAVIADVDAELVLLRGALVQDAILQDVRATEMVLREARIRRVRISGGRIGSLDFSGADIDSLVLEGLKIDYLGLCGVQAHDVDIRSCQIGTLDVPQATLKRFAFHDSEATEVDSRELEASDVDLRGLDCPSYSTVNALHGTTMDAHQVQALAVQMAVQAGIDVKGL